MSYLDSNTEITTTDNTNPLAQPTKDLSYYREALKGLWRKTVEDIIATGRVFSEAKDNLTSAEYRTLMAEFGFERSIAARLRAIYQCLTNVDNYLQKQLPASVSTIYEMSKVGPELLEAKLRRGEWTTATTRADIIPPRQPKKPPSRLNQLRKFMGEHREAIINELVNNPVLCETVPEEIEEMMKEVRERRLRNNGQDEQPPQQQPPVPPSPLPSRWS